jgi:hypothetical protein
MAKQTNEEKDALARSRAEIRLLVGKYQRRLTDRADALVLAEMLKNPNADPEEVGRAAFAQAGEELGLVEGGARPALAGPAPSS